MAGATEAAPPAASLRRLDGRIGLLGRHETDPAFFPHLLESVAYGTPQSRYDILFAAPGDTLCLDAEGRLTGPHAAGGDFLEALDAWWREEGPKVPRGTGPFPGGWFLYLGYETVGQIEPRLRLPRHEGRMPVAFATRCHGAVIHDHETGATWRVAEPGHEDRLDRALDKPGVDPAAPPEWLSVTEDPPERYLDAVSRILHYIRAGDVFQVNVARAWRARAREAVAPSALYRLLRRTNPAPFAGLATFEDSAVVSSSPERLVEVRGDRVQTRPIAGTRPRGRDEQDRALSSELIGHPKERAEHIMLIDLERNDLGRVCKPGSIDVSELMVLESYAHVHHIVSNVTGRLRDDVSPGQVIRAVFPGGTITGCPKVRCMEIIAELETSGRGPYTGAMGYLDGSGDMDMNILIRTLQVEGDRVGLRAGAGIVADSDPQHELAETRAKAKGMLLALGAEET
jgi:anthranilate synthase component 1